MAEPLNAVLQRIPENSEPASPFPAEVNAHADCLHPARRHTARPVERTAVVADRRDVRWLEPHAAVLVDRDRFRWRPLKEQLARDAESRKTGQRKSKRRAARGRPSRRSATQLQYSASRSAESSAPEMISAFMISAI